MELSELIVEFGKKSGLDLPAPDADGMVTFGVDDMVIIVREIPELGKILTYAEIAEEPPQETGKLAQTMMAANYLFQGTGGAALSQDPESKKYYINRYDDIRTMDSDVFSEMIEKFVNVLETWRKLVADYRPDAIDVNGENNASGASDDASGAMPDPLSNGGMPGDFVIL